ncbi:TRAFs-binding domain-containing protein [Sphingobium sp. H39-3-25]|uniref:TRAFs-binding domain-containing protein n=1 Tax=Sphingobium arseniciresistens TaxID=3030834 RepID=UPI0023BA1A0E|nr:TRAFs-binding domain-containing protein [Sphingobium arseniciresistens]
MNNITRLARAGALERAWALFDGGGFLSGSEDPDILTVHGRLLKDRAAQETGAAREKLLNEAIAAYTRASELSRATYPLINAATLAFLAGREEQSRSLATETLALLDSGDYAPETDYWLHATRAEALLLLDRITEAEAALGVAIRCQPEAWEDHASTLRQFGLVLQEKGCSKDWLAAYRPPPCMHFEGIMGIAIDDAAAGSVIDAQVRAIGPSYAIGALAAGADILIAQAAVQVGGQLHVVLPCPAELFCELSVQPFGDAWVTQFHDLMDQAASVLILDDWHPLSEASVVVAREAAMGLAIQESRRLQSFPCALRIPCEGETETSSSDAIWDGLVFETVRVPVSRSNDARSALPPPTQPLALLAVPEAVSDGMGEESSGRWLGMQDNSAIFGFETLMDCAATASAIMTKQPGVRLGIDYRAVPSTSEQHIQAERVGFIASAGLAGAIAVSESAALAMALHLPAANVQPMGNICTSAGDMPVFGLFADVTSGDQFSQ